MSKSEPTQADRAPVEQSRREREKDETRHRIFHAAIDLFRERGFESTTVDDITEKADVAKGTFFNYFPRNETVLGQLADEEISRIEAEAGAILAAPGACRAAVDCNRSDSVVLSLDAPIGVAFYREWSGQLDAFICPAFTQRCTVLTSVLVQTVDTLDGTNVDSVSCDNVLAIHADS